MAVQIRPYNEARTAHDSFLSIAEATSPEEGLRLPAGCLPSLQQQELSHADCPYPFHNTLLIRILFFSLIFNLF